MKKRSVAAIAVAAFTLGLAVTVQGKEMVLTGGVEDTLIRTKTEDGERLNDSDLAHKNLRHEGRSRLGYKDNKEGRFLLRFDVAALKHVEWKSVDKVQVAVPIVYPAQNDPEIRMYAVTEEDGDWKVDEATWRQKKDGAGWAGGYGGGEPGAGTFREKILDTANPSGKHGENVVFEIPPAILGEWLESKLPEGNAGLMLTMNKGATNVETSSSHGNTPELRIQGDWEVPEEFYRSVSGTVRMLGGEQIQKRLFERYLSGALEDYNPNLKKAPAVGAFNTRWHKMSDRGGGAFTRVKTSRYDVTLVSRLDWKWRVNDDIKENMRYIPVAKQGVYRGKSLKGSLHKGPRERVSRDEVYGDDELVGGVEYGIAIRDDVWIPRVQAFVEFCKSDLVQNKLAEKNIYHYMPADAELPEFEPEDWEDPEPWNGPKPMMVHGVDIHTNGWTTAFISQLARAQMKGYNSALGAGIEAALNWADENGFLLSGGARGGGEKLVGHPSAWGYFEINEDSVGQWTELTYKDTAGQDVENPGGLERLEDRWPERVKDFRHAKEKGFRNWVKEKHGTLEKLNTRWDTDYESWDEVTLPDPRLDEVADLYDGILGVKGNEGFQWRLRFGFRGVLYTQMKYPELLDMQRYMRTVWVKYLDDRVELVRENLGDDYLCSTKAKPTPYNHRASEQFNMASFDYGPGKQHPHATQVFIDGVQIPLGWPVWDSEDHKYNHGKSTPRRVRVDIFSEYLMGQFKSTSYDWVKNNRGGARYRYKAAMVTRRRIRKHEDVFRALYEARKNADLAVFTNEGNRAFDVYDPMDEPYDLGAAPKAFGYMDALGRPWKYVLDLDLSADSVTGTLVLDAPWLTDESAQKLAELPADRRIIAIGEVPTTNEYREPLSEEILNTLQERATVVEDWDALSEEVPPAEGLMEPYTRVTTAGFHTWNKYRGRGRWTNEKPVARLALRRVKHDGNLYLAVVNYKDEAITAPIPWADEGEVRNLMADDPEAVIEDTDSYEYPKEGVALFEIK